MFDGSTKSQNQFYHAVGYAQINIIVVCFLSFLCCSSPNFNVRMDIPEQQEIKTIFTSSTKLNTLQLFYNNKNLCLIAARNLKTRRMRTLIMTAVMTRTTASLIMLAVMTRSLMTKTANVICIVIPNSLIVCYWKMKNPLNPIVQIGLRGRVQAERLIRAAPP